MISPDTALPVLQVIRRAAEDEVALDPEAVGKALGTPRTEAIDECLRRLEEAGLFEAGLRPNDPPLFFTAGEQFMDRKGQVSSSVLYFLPKTIDDLNAREAFLRAGVYLIEEFLYAAANGELTGFVRDDVVPPAFSVAVTDLLAVRFFAAASALMARLSGEQPAGCVAEEIVAVRLIGLADTHLDVMAFEGSLSDGEAKAAKGVTDDLFDLFTDDDVYFLFQMEEPADAALAHAGPVNQAMGVVDQRVSAWFEPFSWAAPTGHLTPSAEDL